MKIKVGFYIVFIIQLKTLHAARILAIFGFCTPTQYGFVESLLQKLAHSGHQMTVITNLAQSREVENFRDILIENTKDVFEELEFKNCSINNIGFNHYDVLEAVYNMSFEVCENIFNNRHVRHLMKTESFDLIIIDGFFSESLFGFADYFRAPLVAVSYVSTAFILDGYVGNTSPLSYIPGYNILQPYTSNMNFWLRCLNVALFVLDWIHYHYKYLPVQKKMYEHHFPKATMTFEEVQRNVSLVLINDHYTLSTPRPYVPNMIEVAGMHIPMKADSTISMELNRTLNEAVAGFVYVDIDSQLPSHIMQMLLSEFGKMSQTFLWNAQRHELPDNINFPANVIFHKNLSRYSVLCHKNIKLYICHGTYSKLIDSIHYGVPILGIPHINGIQKECLNFLRKIVHGISLTPKQLKSDTLERVLQELLIGEKYQQNALLLSQRFRDRQNSPMDTAIYWIEYVLRHKGATHMRNLGQNLTSWQYYNLDVIICFTIVIISFIYSAYIVLNVILMMVKMTKYKKIKYC